MTATPTTRATAQATAPGKRAPVVAKPPATVISSSPQPTVAEFAPCTAAQLAGRPGGTDFFMGTDLQYLVLTNTSTRPCTLSGPPTAAVGFRTDGTRQALHIAADMDSPLAGPLANLRPGQSAEADVISADPGRCIAPESTYYTVIAIDVDGTGMARVAFPAGHPFWVATCAAPVYVGGFGVPRA